MNDKIRPIIKGKFLASDDESEGKKVIYADESILKRTLGSAAEGRKVLESMDENSIRGSFIFLKQNLIKKKKEILEKTEEEIHLNKHILEEDFEFTLKLIEDATLISDDKIFLIRRVKNCAEYELFSTPDVLSLHGGFFPPFSWVTKFLVSALVLRIPTILFKSYFPFFFYRELCVSIIEAGFPDSAISFLPMRESLLPEKIISQRLPNIAFFVDGSSDSAIDKIFRSELPLWPRLIFASDEVLETIIERLKEFKPEIELELMIGKNKAEFELFMENLKESGKILNESPLLVKNFYGKIPEAIPGFFLFNTTEPASLKGEILSVFSVDNNLVKTIMKRARYNYMFVNKISYHFSSFTELELTMKSLKRPRLCQIFSLNEE